MLRLFTGRAGTGKTAAVINEIHTAVLEKQGRRLLIVPEQYSHEAERELCRVCGDSMSLYAEVMSFTGLARRIASQQGGSAAPYLDKGGRLLCMALALDGAASRLRVYGSAGRRAETQSALLEAMEEKNVTVDGVTHALPTPFIVLATQNPVGSAGTMMLPNSQLDRFLIRLSMGYPDLKSQTEILRERHHENPLDKVEAVTDIAGLLALIDEVTNVHFADSLLTLSYRITKHFSPGVKEPK